MPAPDKAAAPGQKLPEEHPEMPRRDPHAAPAPEGEAIDAPTQFEGLSLSPPEQWEAVRPEPSRLGPQFTPRAVFRLPSSTDEAVTARLTHFPNMRHVPTAENLKRWYAEFRQPDGRTTADVAQQETFEVEGIKITLVDVSGTRMGRGGAPQADYRMLAAVIEHPEGPHFLKVVGPQADVAQCRESVVQYLRSAKANP
jgi:hypothetical protein